VQSAHQDKSEHSKGRQPYESDPFGGLIVATLPNLFKYENSSDQKVWA
jgi:hypothetical protein